jgi:hypothetical protein
MIIMTKFVKKITKGDKAHENCLVLGNVWGNLDDVVEVFNTVFMLNEGEQPIRRKNVVYRQDFEDVSVLPYITSVFIDFGQLDKIIKIENVIKKFRLSAYIGHGYHLDNHYHRFFNSRGYELVEMNKNYQVWKTKK